jgi:hypothetical protein
MGTSWSRDLLGFQQILLIGAVVAVVVKDHAKKTPLLGAVLEGTHPPATLILVS